ncbi:invasion associated locus B family protein [Niveispirillum lacus]|uniref:invasion associated locus B family protein n=1 Tax=Niveispirillum lacus TaxID=1981099 RepID=UPI001A9C8CB8|nr:invasion associated locus B family protein [Niveispirillum lacus]
MMLPLLLLAAPDSLAAAEPRLIGVFRDWNAFRLDEASGPVCWMVSRPKKMEGDFTRRGDVFLMITHRPAERSFDVVNFIAGYPFADHAEVTVQVGKQSFKLFSKDEQAWARDENTDRAIAQALPLSSTLVVRGTSLRGSRTTDTFSLAGSTGAYQAIGDACAERAPAAEPETTVPVPAPVP